MGNGRHLSATLFHAGLAEIALRRTSHAMGQHMSVAVVAPFATHARMHYDYRYV